MQREKARSEWNVGNLIGESHAILKGDESVAEIGAGHGSEAFGEGGEVGVDPGFDFGHAHLLGLREGAEPRSCHRLPFFRLLLCLCFLLFCGYICVAGVRHAAKTTVLSFFTKIKTTTLLTLNLLAS